MEARIEKIKQHLQSQGYKLTPQREATVRVLLENEEDHLSAEDVFMLVKDKFPEIGLATVYRTLELLSEMHVVEKMNSATALPDMICEVMITTTIIII